MGFSDLWVLFDAESPETKRSINKHICCDKLTPNNPWLVIDASNINYAVSRLSGGNFRLFSKYCEAFWRAVYFSKFKILVVKDGAHNAQRGVIKIHRMLQRTRYLDPSREEDINDNALFYESSEIRARVLREAMAEFGADLVARSVNAPEEADDEIRKFGRGIKTDVLILSNDTSLILGLDDNKFIVSMSRLVLSPKAGHKYPMLYGPALKLGNLCTMWSKAVYKSLYEIGLRDHIIEDLKKAQKAADGNVSPINTESLLLISCLLEGEYEDYDQNEIANSPVPFLIFLKNYCFHYNSPLRSSNDRYQKRKLDFIVACIAVMVFSRHQIQLNGKAQYSSFDGFELILEEAKAVAAAVIAQEPAGQNLFELQRRNSGTFHNVCEKLLAMDVEAVMGVLRKRLSLLTSNHEEAPAKPLYLAQWGTWTFSEPNSPDHNTDAILHPFVSLMRQVTIAGHSPAVAVEPLTDSEASSADFDEYLRRLITIAAAASEPDSSRTGAAPTVWLSKLVYRVGGDVEVFSKTQLFTSVEESNSNLPRIGVLTGQESAVAGPLSPAPPSPAGGAAAGPGAAVPPASPAPQSSSAYVAYSAPRPLIFWECVDDVQYATDILYRHNFGTYALPLAGSHNKWNNSASNSLFNLVERSKLLSKISSGLFNTAVPTEAVGAAATRLAHPFIEILLETAPALAEISKPIHKFWKKYFGTSFDDKDQCKASSLGAALILFGFAQTYDSWAREDGHSYSWTTYSADKILENIVDAVILSPVFANFVNANVSVVDGIEKNIKKAYPQIYSKAPEKCRNVSRQSYRWAELLHVLVKETHSAANVFANCCSSDLFAWFDGIGIALVLQLGLRSESYFPAHQCAALWCDELSAFMGFKDTELESVVTALSEARAAVVTEIRKN